MATIHNPLWKIRCGNNGGDLKGSQSEVPHQYFLQVSIILKHIIKTEEQIIIK